MRERGEGARKWRRANDHAASVPLKTRSDGEQTALGSQLRLLSRVEVIIQESRGGESDLREERATSAYEAKSWYEVRCYRAAGRSHNRRPQVKKYLPACFGASLEHRSKLKRGKKRTKSSANLIKTHRLVKEEDEKDT